MIDFDFHTIFRINIPSYYKHKFYFLNKKKKNLNKIIPIVSVETHLASSILFAILHVNLVQVPIVRGVDEALTRRQRRAIILAALVVGVAFAHGQIDGERCGTRHAHDAGLLDQRHLIEQTCLVRARLVREHEDARVQGGEHEHERSIEWSERRVEARVGAHRGYGCDRWLATTARAHVARDHDRGHAECATAVHVVEKIVVTKELAFVENVRLKVWKKFGN